MKINIIGMRLGNLRRIERNKIEAEKMTKITGVYHKPKPATFYCYKEDYITSRLLVVAPALAIMLQYNQQTSSSSTSNSNKNCSKSNTSNGVISSSSSYSANESSSSSTNNFSIPPTREGQE
jgi:hypothetical protein